MSRWCEKCGVKLGHRNPKRRANGKYKCRNLCQRCYNNPTEEERCVAISLRTNKRCKHRAVPESKMKYCGTHKRMREDKE